MRRLLRVLQVQNQVLQVRRPSLCPVLKKRSKHLATNMSHLLQRQESQNKNSTQILLKIIVKLYSDKPSTQSWLFIRISHPTKKIEGKKSRIPGIKIPRLKKSWIPGSEIPRLTKSLNPEESIPISGISGFSGSLTRDFSKLTRDFFGIFKSLSRSPGFLDFRVFYSGFF